MSDALTLTGRCLRLSRRNVEALITSLMLPVMLMLLFVYLFGGAIRTDSRYVDYVVPGVIVLCVGFGASVTAISVTEDMKRGVVDRFRSLDVSGAAMLSGHVAASLVRNAVSTVLVLGVAVLIGFRPAQAPSRWLATAGVLLVFAAAMSWLAAVVGLFAGSPEAANGFTFFISFLPYASSAFVPVETMPQWLHGFAGNQPYTPMIEAVRALLNGTSVGSSVWVALAWWTGVLLFSVVASRLLFARRTSAQ